MKLRQRAVLRTVQRWAEIVFLGVSPIDRCELCDAATEGGRIDCDRCPYVEVFCGNRCRQHFPSVLDGPLEMRCRAKLRRALGLAKQYGLHREALAIVREVVAEVRGG